MRPRHDGNPGLTTGTERYPIRFLVRSSWSPPRKPGLRAAGTVLTPRDARFRGHDEKA